MNQKLKIVLQLAALTLLFMAHRLWTEPRCACEPYTITIVQGCDFLYAVMLKSLHLWWQERRNRRNEAPDTTT
jgi:hypothetical protein